MAGLLLAGCGASAPDLPSSTNLTPVSSAGGSNSAAASPTSPRSTSNGATQTVTGTVSDTGLTCLVFDTGGGGRYALTGDVPAAVARMGHGLGPGSASGKTVTIRVTGHYAPDLLSTCSLRVFVADKVVVLSSADPSAATG